MKTGLRSLAVSLVSYCILSLVTPLQATESNVWLNLEGNPTCSSLGDNQAILEVRDNDPVLGLNQVTGKRIDAAGKVVGTQTITYLVEEIANRKFQVSSWNIELNGSVTNSSVNPVNYSILKARGKAGARVYHFGGIGEGALQDSEESAPSNDPLAAVSFCYGLTVGKDSGNGVDLAALPNCEELSQTSTGLGDLYTTGIECPEGGEQQLIINMALNKPNFGFKFDDGTVRACTCNVTLPACNPDLAAQDINDPDYDPKTAAERSCMEYGGTTNANVPSGVNERVPFAIHGVENPDSYICYTIGGRRYCYGHY